MIEYNLNSIKATGGEDICICAKILDAYGDPIAACSLSLFHEDGQKLVMIPGRAVDGEMWEFIIPAATTLGRYGRYFYCICDENHSSLCFKEPIYLI